MERAVIASGNDALGGAVLRALAAIDRAAAERRDARSGTIDAGSIGHAAQSLDVLAVASTVHILYDPGAPPISAAPPH